MHKNQTYRNLPFQKYILCKSRSSITKIFIQNYKWNKPLKKRIRGKGINKKKADIKDRKGKEMKERKKDQFLLWTNRCEK